MTIFSKKILSALTALSLSVLMFSGCTKNDDSSKKDKTSSAIDSSSVLDIDSSDLDSSKISDATPLFWKATNSDGDFIYLLGSIHVGNEDLYDLNDTIMNAYDECDSLAVEVDIVKLESDLAFTTELTKAVTYADGTTIEDHLSEEVYNKAKTALTENGLYLPTFDSYVPYMWTSFFDMLVLGKSGLTSEYGVDRHFLELAKSENKNIIELESAKSQIDMLIGFSDKLNELLLESYLDIPIDEQAQKLKDLYSAYIKGDLEELTSFLLDDTIEITEDEKPYYDEYQKAMMIDRNKLMVDKAKGFIDNGEKVFYVVGLAHMIGDTGIVDELTKAGYTVTQLK